MTALPDSLLDQVQNSIRTSDPRMREILQSAVRHLHAFVAEVRLTHAEWEAAIGFLTAVGQACTPTRQEFILLSDVLGVSSQVEMTSAGTPEGATENTVLGPFYVPGSPVRQMGESILEDDEDEGPRAIVTGRVLDLGGSPVEGARLDIWQNASNGLYAVQDPDQNPMNLRGVFVTGPDGRFAFRTVRPVPYSIPDDGPVGALLTVMGRHPWRPAHIHFLVTAPGCVPLTTHVFDGESDYLDTDAVFGVRNSLVMTFRPADEGEFAADFDILLTSASA